MLINNHGLQLSFHVMNLANLASLGLPEIGSEQLHKRHHIFISLKNIFHSKNSQQRLAS